MIGATPTPVCMPTVRRRAAELLADCAFGTGQSEGKVMAVTSAALQVEGVRLNRRAHMDTHSHARAHTHARTRTRARMHTKRPSVCESFSEPSALV